MKSYYYILSKNDTSVLFVTDEKCEMISYLSLKNIPKDSDKYTYVIQAGNGIDVEDVSEYWSQEKFIENMWLK